MTDTASGPTRRALARGAAWSVPSVVVSMAAPAYAASGCAPVSAPLGNALTSRTATGDHTIAGSTWSWDGSKGDDFREHDDTDVTKYLLTVGTGMSTPIDANPCSTTPGPAARIEGNVVWFKGDATVTGSWLSVYTRTAVTLTAGCTYTMSMPWLAAGSYTKNMTVRMGIMSSLPTWTDTGMTPAWVASTAVTSTSGKNTNGTATVTYRPTSTGNYYLGYHATYPNTTTAGATGCAAHINDIAVGSPTITAA